MRKQVEAWQRSELTDVTAKVVVTKPLSRESWRLPNILPGLCMTSTSSRSMREFRSRTIWSLSNAFTSAFKVLDPIPQFKATAKLGEFLEAWLYQSF
jgi:hypothetical protein